VMRISQLENVVVVGENTRGALTFGNVAVHRLPNSRLRVWLPVNLNLFLDMESREAVGLAPDLWVPAADVVNYAVAAVRDGTISTALPLPAEVLEQEFVPEDPWSRNTRERILYGVVAGLMGVAGLTWAYIARKNPRVVAGAGAVWVVLGGLWTLLSPLKPVGPGLLLAGVGCLVRGGVGLLSARRSG